MTHDCSATVRMFAVDFFAAGSELSTAALCAPPKHRPAARRSSTTTPVPGFVAVGPERSARKAAKEARTGAAPPAAQALVAPQPARRRFAVQVPTPSLLELEIACAGSPPHPTHAPRRPEPLLQRLLRNVSHVRSDFSIRCCPSVIHIHVHIQDPEIHMASKVQLNL